MVINGSHHLYASHPLRIEGDVIRCALPAGVDGWMVLSEAALPEPTRADLDRWAPDAPEMPASMAALERDHSPDGLLYRRHLECFDARQEGAFLAGTFWVAPDLVALTFELFEAQGARCELTGIGFDLRVVGCGQARCSHGSDRP